MFTIGREKYQKPPKDNQGRERVVGKNAIFGRCIRFDITAYTMAYPGKIA